MIVREVLYSYSDKNFLYPTKLDILSQNRQQIRERELFLRNRHPASIPPSFFLLSRFPNMCPCSHHWHSYLVDFVLPRRLRKSLHSSLPLSSTHAPSHFTIYGFPLTLCDNMQLAVACCHTLPIFWHSMSCATTRPISCATRHCSVHPLLLAGPANNIMLLCFNARCGDW